MDTDRKMDTSQADKMMPSRIRFAPSRTRRISHHVMTRIFGALGMQTVSDEDSAVVLTIIEETIGGYARKYIAARDANRKLNKAMEHRLTFAGYLAAINTSMNALINAKHSLAQAVLSLSPASGFCSCRGMLLPKGAELAMLTSSGGKNVQVHRTVMPCFSKEAWQPAVLSEAIASAPENAVAGGPEA
jgi:hypothetical protein